MIIEGIRNGVKKQGREGKKATSVLIKQVTTVAFGDQVCNTHLLKVIPTWGLLPEDSSSGSSKPFPGYLHSITAWTLLASCTGSKAGSGGQKELPGKEMQVWQLELKLVWTEVIRAAGTGVGTPCLIHYWKGTPTIQNILLMEKF